ncbi:hypothetical protein HYH02_009458 [Chlamydomonas schloesseri]|uniref:Uncharacterized protein n=1 Tax=Chlamydomonas schloesseri TaxID=2026947 RepID=A0A835TGF5_9CHLO|nr:hypothetical protein HYH02_009458 [Chlamydomonas schloesseri]|eukprot:KAG2443043.1 hypothetical protein HYH02_009458 [Chlamydomonas schloesseri]
MASGSDWASELLGHALILGAPVAFCYAGSYISGLYSRMEQELVQTFTKAQLGPWEAAAMPGPVLEADNSGACRSQQPPAAAPLLQYHNATFSRQSVGAVSVCTDCGVYSECDDDDLDFCLVTPQQAMGALGSHAPRYTKIFLNGLPLMADATDPSATLSVDECARRIKLAADSNRSRTGANSYSRATCSPCLTPMVPAGEDGLIAEEGLDAEVLPAPGRLPLLRRHHSHTQPLQRSRSRLMQRSLADLQAQQQQQQQLVEQPEQQQPEEQGQGQEGEGAGGLAADPRRPSGNGSFYRSGACSSAGSFRSTTSSLHTVYSSSSVFSCPSQRSSIDMPQETAATAARTQERSQGDTEGPHQHHPLAAPQVSCPIPGGLTPIITIPAAADDDDATPFAALASAPLSCPGAPASGADACSSPFATAARVASERRRSISEVGGGMALCFGEDDDAQHRARDTDGGAGRSQAAYGVEEDDDMCMCLDSPRTCTSAPSACELRELFTAASASPCSSSSSVADGSGGGANSPDRSKSSCGAGGAGSRGAAPRAAARSDQQQQQQAPKRRWLPSGACHAPPLPVPPRPQHPQPSPAHCRSSHSFHRINLSASVDGLPMAVLRHSRSSPAAALPPLPPKAPSVRHGSEPMPPRGAPARAPCSPAVAAAAAAAAAAPAGLSKAPALPLPPDASAACVATEAAVPPALRYYLRQARAAGVNVDAANAGAPPVSATLDLSADGGSGRQYAQGCGRPAGYVKATAREYSMRHQHQHQVAKSVITCHISPFPSPRQAMRKAKSPPHAK